MTRVQNLGFATLMLGIFVVMPAVAVFNMERASDLGHTNITVSGRDFPTEDNYGVFKNERTIRITGNPFPVWLVERNGEITRVNVVMNKVLPVKTYTPANEAEKALYLKYFS